MNKKVYSAKDINLPTFPNYCIPSHLICIHLTSPPGPPNYGILRTLEFVTTHVLLAYDLCMGYSHNRECPWIQIALHVSRPDLSWVAAGWRRLTDQSHSRLGMMHTEYTRVAICVYCIFVAGALSNAYGGSVWPGCVVCMCVCVVNEWIWLNSVPETGPIFKGEWMDYASCLELFIDDASWMYFVTDSVLYTECTERRVDVGPWDISIDVSVSISQYFNLENLLGQRHCPARHTCARHRDA